MSFHIDQAAMRIKELEDTITANDEYLQKLQDEGIAKDIQIEGLSNMLAELGESHAELLAALRRSLSWLSSYPGAMDSCDEQAMAAIAKAEHKAMTTQDGRSEP